MSKISLSFPFNQSTHSTAHPPPSPYYHPSLHDMTKERPWANRPRQSLKKSNMSSLTKNERIARKPMSKFPSLHFLLLQAGAESRRRPKRLGFASLVQTYNSSFSVWVCVCVLFSQPLTSLSDGYWHVQCSWDNCQPKRTRDIIYSTICTVQCVLYPVCCTLCTIHCVLYTVYCTLCTVQCVLYNVYCTLCTVHCVLYIHRPKVFAENNAILYSQFWRDNTEVPNSIILFWTFLGHKHFLK